MSLQEAAARVATLTALRDAIADELTAAKDELSTGLGSLHQEYGTDRVAATLPGGDRVGTVSWVPSSVRFRVADEAVFAEWVLANHPSEVRTILQVRPVWQTLYLKEGLRAVGKQAVDRFTGELVDGVEAFDSAPYSRLSFSRQGRSDIAAAWREGRITTEFLAILPPNPQGDH